MTDPFYNSLPWWKLRAKVAKRAYRCALCATPFRKGEVKVVDHIVRRKARPDLALEESNLQVLCKTCHDSVKKRMENGKQILKVGLDGWPEENG